MLNDKRMVKEFGPDTPVKRKEPFFRMTFPSKSFLLLQMPGIHENGRVKIRPSASWQTKLYETILISLFTSNYKVYYT